MTTATQSGFVLKGWHVWSMVGAFFGTIITVNAIFITLAVQSFPGEDVKRSYVQGLEYNKTLDARARQAALGWNAAARFDGAPGAAALVVEMTDRSGAPLSGLTISAELRRAVTDKHDHALTFVDQGHGVYRAEIGALDRGGWSLKGQASAEDERFEFTGRLAWQP